MESEISIEEVTMRVTEHENDNFHYVYLMFHCLEILTQHVFFMLRVKNKEFENGNCLEIFTQHGFFHVACKKQRV